MPRRVTEIPWKCRTVTGGDGMNQQKQSGQRLVRVQSGALGSGLLRRIGPHGAMSVALPHAPTTRHQVTTALHAPKAKKIKGKNTHHSSGTHSTNSGSHHTLTDADVVQIILSALQGGALRLAIEDIALQVYWQLQSQQNSAMQQGGSYQRQGGF